MLRDRATFSKGRWAAAAGHRRHRKRSALVLLERHDIMASAAASCASGAMDPSHVLAAMGFEREAAAGSLRLSLGWCTEDWEIDHALNFIPKCVEQLRRKL